MRALDGNTLAGLVSRVSRDDASDVVEDHGEPEAAFVSIDDLRRLVALEEAGKRQWVNIDEARAVFADVPDDEHGAQEEGRAGSW